MNTVSDLIFDIELEVACLLDDLEVDTLEEDVKRLQKMIAMLAKGIDK